MEFKEEGERKKNHTTRRTCVYVRRSVSKGIKAAVAETATRNGVKEKREKRKEESDP